MLRSAHLAFKGCFGDVHQDRSAFAAGELGSFFQVVGRERVDRMGRDGGRDQRIVLPLVDKFFAVGERGSRSFVIGGGEVEDGFAEHSAHAGFFGDLRGYVLEVIHVSEAGDAAAEHFEDAETRAPEDEILGYVACFGGEDVSLEPVVERMVFGDAAEQAHGGVHVAVDHARHQDAAPGVDRLCGPDFRFQLYAGADRGDGVAFDGDCAVFDDAPFGVHRDDGAAADQEIHSAPQEYWAMSIFASMRLSRGYYSHPVQNRKPALPLYFAPTNCNVYAIAGSNGLSITFRSMSCWYMVVQRSAFICPSSPPLVSSPVTKWPSRSACQVKSIHCGFRAGFNLAIMACAGVGSAR